MSNTRDPTLVRPVSLDMKHAVVERTAENVTAKQEKIVPRRVEHVTDRDFQKKVLDSEEAVLVDFYADWCGPCKKLGPVLDQLAKDTPDAKIVKVNIDRSPKLADNYNVSSIPTLILFKDGKPAARRGGLTTKASLKQFIRQ